jgi:membrane protease YdiL (CAAX protease family)
MGTQNKETVMERTRSNQGAQGMARLSQLVTHYPVVVGFILLMGRSLQKESSMMHPTEFLKRHSLIIGFVLMFALTWPLDVALAAQSHGLLPFHIPEILGLFVGYGFVVASLIMTGLTLGKDGLRTLLRRLLAWRVGIQWYLVALFSLTAIDLLALALSTLLSGTMPDFTKVFAGRFFGDSTNLWYFILPVFLVEALTNGEEIGWRGYALPRLQTRYSALVSSLIIGVIWAVWHIPHFLMAGNTISFGWFLLDIIAKAVLFTWVYNNTNGSLLVATLFHAANNTAGAFLPITASVSGVIQPFAIAVVIQWIVAITVTVLAGPVRLSRRPPVQVQV